MSAWIDLGSDTDWKNYEGTWAKKGPDGAWYIVKFENMYEAMGEHDAKVSGTSQYYCRVLRIDLNEIDAKRIARACADLVCREDLDGSWTFQTLRVRPNADEAALVYGLLSYGIYAPLKTFTSHNAAVKIRDQAKRYANQLMRDPDELEECLDQQVNAIGNTARDFGRGRLGWNDD